MRIQKSDVGSSLVLVMIILLVASVGAAAFWKFHESGRSQSAADQERRLLEAKAQARFQELRETILDIVQVWTQQPLTPAGPDFPRFVTLNWQQALSSTLPAGRARSFIIEPNETVEIRAVASNDAQNNNGRNDADFPKVFEIRYARTSEQGLSIVLQTRAEALPSLVSDIAYAIQNQPARPITFVSLTGIEGLIVLNFQEPNSPNSLVQFLGASSFSRPVITNLPRTRIPPGSQNPVETLRFADRPAPDGNPNLRGTAQFQKGVVYNSAFRETGQRIKSALDGLENHPSTTRFTSSGALTGYESSELHVLTTQVPASHLDLSAFQVVLDCVGGFTTARIFEFRSAANANQIFQRRLPYEPHNRENRQNRIESEERKKYDLLVQESLVSSFGVFLPGRLPPALLWIGTPAAGPTGGPQMEIPYREARQILLGTFTFNPNNTNQVLALRGKPVQILANQIGSARHCNANGALLATHNIEFLSSVREHGGTGTSNLIMSTKRNFIVSEHTQVLNQESGPNSSTLERLHRDRTNPNDVTFQLDLGLIALDQPPPGGGHENSAGNLVLDPSLLALPNHERRTLGQMLINGALMLNQGPGLSRYRLDSSESTPQIMVGFNRVNFRFPPNFLGENAALGFNEINNPGVLFMRTGPISVSFLADIDEAIAEVQGRSQ